MCRVCEERRGGKCKVEGEGSQRAAIGYELGWGREVVREISGPAGSANETGGNKTKPERERTVNQIYRDKAVVRQIELVQLENRSYRRPGAHVPHGYRWSSATRRLDTPRGEGAMSLVKNGQRAFGVCVGEERALLCRRYTMGLSGRMSMKTC